MFSATRPLSAQNIKPHTALTGLRPFMGVQEFINGSARWILALHHAPPQTLHQLPHVLQRMDAVKQFRLSSKSEPTRQLAQTPILYHVKVIPERPFLVIPRVSSERREYISIGWLEPPVIPNDSRWWRSIHSAQSPAG